MTQKPKTHVESSILIMRVTVAEVMGDALSDELRDECIETYTQSGATHIIFDMSMVKYLSSAGIRTLVTVNRKVRENAGRFIITNLNENIAGALMATRLISSSRSIPVSIENCPDVPAAVALLYTKE